VILIHQRHRQTDRQTDRRTDGQHAISIPRYAVVHRAVITETVDMNETFKQYVASHNLFWGQGDFFLGGATNNNFGGLVVAYITTHKLK